MTTQGSAPLNIMHVFRAPVGGLFRHVYDVAKAQAAAGHRVGFICDSSTGGVRGNGLIEELLPSLALGVHRLPMRRNPHPTDWAALKLVKRLSSELRLDVLHGHGAKGALYARFGGVFSPDTGPIRCYTPHGGSLNYHPGSLLHRLYMVIERVLERGTDLFTFESAFVHDRFREFVCETQRPQLIALNGLYEHEFNAVIPAVEAADFLYVGEFREAKGIDTLVEAMSLLAKRGLKPTIQMVGSGPSEEPIHALIHERRLDAQFRWRGVTPAAEAFRLGRVMVVPSRFESLPYIVLEAVAGQLPLITTSVGGIPEIVRRDYHYLIPPNDPTALADAMQSAYERPVADLAAEAAALSADIRQQFTVPIMVETILGGYRRALAHRRPNGTH